MSANYNAGGNQVNQSGHARSGNISLVQNQGPADPQAAFREMISAVQVLRGQVSAADRQVIDESMHAIGTGSNVEKGTLRRALGNIAGVATMVGQVGVPVIESVHAVMAAFGL
jgi:hypothetical protein